MQIHYLLPVHKVLVATMGLRKRLFQCVTPQLMSFFPTEKENLKPTEHLGVRGS